MSEMDDDELLEFLATGAARGQRIAAARPSWGQLGGALWQYHGVMLNVFYPGEDRESLVAPRGSLISPVANSHAAEDARLTAGCELNSANELVLKLAHMYIGAIINHLGGLAAVVEAGVAARPAIALARVVLEGAAHCNHLLDADATATERTIRAANIQIEMLLSEIKDLAVVALLDDQSAKAETSRLNAELDSIHASAVSDGLARVVSKKGDPQAYLVPPPVPTEQLLAQHEYGSTYLSEWRHGSSVVHVKEREAIEFVIGSGDFVQDTHGRSYVARMLMSSLTLATEALARAAHYFGRTEPSLERERSQLLEFWSYATGMQDEKIAAKLGI